MLESDDGVSVSCTRQNDGSPVIARGVAVPSAGGVNDPAGTAVAASTFAFGIFSDATRLSHVAACDTAGSRNRQQTKAAIFMKRILAVVRPEMRGLCPCADGISRSGRC